MKPSSRNVRACREGRLEAISDGRLTGSLERVTVEFAGHDQFSGEIDLAKLAIGVNLAAGFILEVGNQMSWLLLRKLENRRYNFPAHASCYAEIQQMAVQRRAPRQTESLMLRDTVQSVGLASVQGNWERNWAPTLAISREPWLRIILSTQPCIN